MWGQSAETSSRSHYLLVVGSTICTVGEHVEAIWSAEGKWCEAAIPKSLKQRYLVSFADDQNTK